MIKRKKSSAKHASQARLEPFVLWALRLRILAGITLVVLASFLAYLPSLSGGFLLDDDKLLTANEHIKASDGLYRFWCTTEPYDYWPVANTTLWIEWRLWGMNPTGYRVTNLLLHIAASLLIWLILLKLSIPGAFLAAMIFALHPVNVDSVAWIAQRKGDLAIVFFLLSILWYLQADMQCRGTKRWYWLSFAACMLAMLSKGSVAVLPVLLLGIVWWLRPLTRWDLVRMAPFFVVAAVLVVVNMWFQTHLGSSIRTAAFTERLLGAGTVVWFYLYKAMLPINLVFIYPLWHIDPGNFRWWLPLAAAVIVTAVLWLYRKIWSRPILFAWGFFCVALAPVTGFTDVGFMKHSLVADHYQHIAIIGVIALAAAAWSTWHERMRGPARSAANTAAFVAVSALALLTWQQSRLYSDTFVLYRLTLEKNPDCFLIHNNFGSALAQTGRPREAIEHYEQALQLNPNFSEAHNNLGNALGALGRWQEAIGHYQQAIQIMPNNPEAYNNLAFALIQTGHLPEAIEQFHQAIRLKSNFVEAYDNLAFALTKAGRLPEAIDQYQQALRLDPNSLKAYTHLGVALAQAGRLPEAIEQYEQALKLNPDLITIHNNLGICLVNTDRMPEAIEHFQKALRLKPDLIEARVNLALAYAELGQSSEAIAAAQKALAVARSQGQTALVKRIEDWLNSYSAKISGQSAPPPPSKSAPPTP